MIEEALHMFVFKSPAGSPERRMLMAEVVEWLRENVGPGGIGVEYAEAPNRTDVTWYIRTFTIVFKVYLKRDEDATVFALRWS